MHQFIGEQWAYSLINYIAFVVMMIYSLFYYNSKRDVISLYSKYVIHRASCINIYFGKGFKFILASAESLIMAYMINLSSYMNVPFGKLIGTGGNYFALLFLTPIAWFVISAILIINPLKQADITTMCVPVYLFFVKIACFCQGCCWGIPWEHGLYNYHSSHPGNQVPVQAIEAFWAVAIFIFLLWYRKKAKCGTMYPMYMILYSATRFPVEFLSAAHEKIIGPFNTYHILCAIGVGIGLLLLLIVNLFGEKISNIFESAHNKLDEKMMLKAELNAQAIEEKNSQMETERKERLEKTKKAREKASIKYKK